MAVVKMELHGMLHHQALDQYTSHQALISHITEFRKIYDPCFSRTPHMKKLTSDSNVTN